MPQASAEDQARMNLWFGTISDGPIIQFLESRGYALLPSYVWEKPTPSHHINDEEFYCLRFLVDEWDYGGVVATFEGKPIPKGYEIYEGKLMKVLDGGRSGWWRYHQHYDRDGYCDNPARGY